MKIRLFSGVSLGESGFDRRGSDIRLMLQRKAELQRIILHGLGAEVLHQLSMLLA
jgi:hypothetical protein